MTYADYLKTELDIQIPEDLGHDFFTLNRFLESTGQFDAHTQQKAADYYGLPLVTEVTDDITAELVAPLNLSICKEYKCLPLAQNDTQIIFAMANPDLGSDIMDDYAKEHNLRVRPVYMPEGALKNIINATFDRIQQSAEDVASSLSEEPSLTDDLQATEDLLDANDDAPVIRLINSILAQAIKEKASDIHIEPFEKQVVIRFRVDGVLRTIVTPSKKLHAAMSARLKVMSELDIAETRLPQDGRFKITLAGKEMDVRISILPTSHGERVVMRLLGRDEQAILLKDMGLRDSQLIKLQNLLKEPNGIILVSGPTGSGKTTTLYAGIREINKPDINIVTVEDPVEYQLDGIGQIQVNTKIGLTFAEGLRSILRQDPDVVVIGETRDTETAQIAVQASLTGHLVLTTIHTNDAPSAVTRLIDMGIEPFLVGSSLRAVIAQRLLRTLDDSSKEEIKITPEIRKIFTDNLPKDLIPRPLKLYAPMPSELSTTGYLGRAAVCEMLEVTPGLRRLVNDNVSDTQMRELAQSEGMLTLFQEALLLAAQGKTTLEEVFRVTKAS